MKNIQKYTRNLALAVLLFGSLSYAGSNTIAYQGVAFDNGVPKASTQIAARFTIYESDGTTQVFTEDVTNISTTDKGFFSHQIGSVQTVAFGNITWADDYKLEVSVDYANGTNFTSLGMQYLSSSAYAFKAKSAESATKLTTPINIGGVSFDGSADIVLPGVNSAGDQNTTGNAATATALTSPIIVNGTTLNGGSNGTINPYTTSDSSNNNWPVVFKGSTLDGAAPTFYNPFFHYNPSTNSLTAANFLGNATSATTATTATTTTGNAATATTLATPRTIGGVSFNGSQNINLPGVNTAGNQNTSGNAATATTAATATNASNVYVGQSWSYTTDSYIPLVGGTGSNQQLNGWVNLRYNVANHTISANITGRATTATTATTATYATYANSYLLLTGGTVTGQLNVTGSALNGSSISYGYLNSGGAGTSSGNNAYSIVANERIRAAEFNAVSDKRIKTDIKPIENALETISKLKPSSYTKIDKVANGDRVHYGFIAQELEEIIPEAVSISDGEVPVLKKFDEAILEDGVTYTLEVSKDGNTTREEYNTTQPRPQGDVFVINKKVDDFRVVNYDMVFTVAVEAIKEQQEEIETLKSELAQIKELLKSK